VDCCASCASSSTPSRRARWCRWAGRMHCVYPALPSTLLPADVLLSGCF
jgi:hypothetical protein